MPADINGYNATFQSFVDFARQRADVADETSIARITSTTVSLNGDQTHTIKASTTDKLGFFASIFRSSADRADNRATRETFRKAVADMFGGESRIPPSVKDAMKLNDFGHGRPLTARRILAIQSAIDATGILRNAALTRDPGFANPATAARATQMGFSRAELPTVARAIRYYQQAMGCTEAVAANEILTPGTKANRLLNYGGRFLASAENFRNGLRLLDDFAAWYGGLRQVRGLSGAALAAQADSPSKLHVRPRAIELDATRGFERTVFEDIARDPDFDFRETDPERAFGFEHNATTRFIGRDLSSGAYGTINRLPPSKRRVLYAAFDVLAPLPTAPGGADPAADVTLKSVQIARIAKHIDELAILHDRGQLTAAKIVDICYPDLPSGSSRDLAGINAFLDQSSSRIYDSYNFEDGLKLHADLESTGATIPEVIAAHRQGRTLPPQPYHSSESLKLSENDGSPATARILLNQDITRPDPYGDASGNDPLPAGNSAFDFRFPDLPQGIKVDQAHADNADTVADKVEALCGRAHPRQTSAVFNALSQTSLLHFRSQPFRQYGIGASEHSPVKYTLSRNNDTGAVTIHFANPDGLPVHFSWQTTIDIDGNATSTPMVVTPPRP